MLDTVSESGEKTAQTLVGGLLSPIHRVTPQNCLRLQRFSVWTKQSVSWISRHDPAIDLFEQNSDSSKIL